MLYRSRAAGCLSRLLTASAAKTQTSSKAQASANVGGRFVVVSGGFGLANATDMESAKLPNPRIGARAAIQIAVNECPRTSTNTASGLAPLFHAQVATRNHCHAVSSELFQELQTNVIGHLVIETPEAHRSHSDLRLPD